MRLLCIIIIIIIIMLLIPGTIWAIKSEKRDFNNGICPRCNNKYRLMDYTSHGDRLYICDKCNSVIFVSYKCVDKDFNK